MSATAESTPLLSVREVAERLSVSPVTVRRWIACGELPALRIGSTVRVDPERLSNRLHEREL